MSYELGQGTPEPADATLVQSTPPYVYEIVPPVGKVTDAILPVTVPATADSYVMVYALPS